MRAWPGDVGTRNRAMAEANECIVKRLSAADNPQIYVNTGFERITATRGGEAGRQLPQAAGPAPILPGSRSSAGDR